MYLYVFLQAIAAIVVGILIAKRTKKADGVVYVFAGSLISPLN